MTQDIDSPEAEGDEGPPQRPPETADWLLQYFVAAANLDAVDDEIRERQKEDGGLGVTLSVQGSTITGTIIGGLTYFELLREIAGAPEDNPQFAAWTEFYRLGEDDPNVGTPLFIHLRDAAVFAPGQPQLPQEPFRIWRGRIDLVGGFAFGLLGTGRSPTKPVA